MKIRIGPVALTATYGTNILNPPAVSGGVGCGSPAVYLDIEHLIIVNKTNVSQTFRLFIGATGGTAAGTEVGGYDRVVLANQVVELWDVGVLSASDFLTGGAANASALTLEGTAELTVEY
ncbi:MAG: hypothetical protein KGL39_08015 [Patescibacteria group bacterium]|nr:hypothetical protein [Patescibacteria group bacterium]